MRQQSWRSKPPWTSPSTAQRYSVCSSCTGQQNSNSLKCLPTATDRSEVLAGNKEKRSPLKVQCYNAIVEAVKEMSDPTGQAAEALANTDIGWSLQSLSNCNKPPEDGKAWGLVAMFSPNEQGRALRRMCDDASRTPRQR